MSSRPLPWTDIVAAIGAERFVEMHASLEAAKVDDLFRDAFLMNGAVGQLLRDLMPDDAPTDALTAYGALIHMMYVCWARDWPVVPVDAAALRGVLASPTPLTPSDPPTVCYVQLPERIVWAEPVTDEPHEPMDGVFVVRTKSRVDVLGVLGFRAGRDGFTTMEGAIALPAPAPEPRKGGSAPFSTMLPGGDKAGLVSVVDEHELSALALLALGTAGS